MGYYTDYDLSSLTDEQLDKVNEVSGYGFTHSYNDSCKWYGCVEDMKKVSLLFPDEVLEISGKISGKLVRLYGEESGDVWQAYFKNGKAQMCKAVLTFEDFDENKLI